MPRWCRRGVLAWTLAVSWAALAHGQNQTQFRGGVELIPIDVTVVDKAGRPISDLRPPDFTLRVDGVLRRVVSADWVAPVPSARGRARPSPRADVSSSNESTSSGRFILIVIDQPNIRRGGVVSYRPAIIDFVKRLKPSDRVGVVNLGVGGTFLSFTTDREQVKQTLAKSAGGVPYPPSIKPPGEQTVDALRALLTQLRTIDAPKTLVLVSQGLLFDEHARPSIPELERAAAAARTTIYALQLNPRISDVAKSAITKKEDDGLPRSFVPELPPPADGGSRTVPNAPFPAGPAGDRGPQGSEAAGELYSVAAATGGAMFTVVMTADSALARIEAELSGSYLLGIESDPADGEDRPHSLRVEVGRRGTVRSAKYLPSAIQSTPTGASPDQKP